MVKDVIILHLNQEKHTVHTARKQIIHQLIINDFLNKSSIS